MYSPAGAMLQTGSRKIQCKYVGPLVILEALSDNQYVLMSLDGKLYPHVIESTRLKPGYIKTATGYAESMIELKSAISAQNHIQTSNC